MFTPTTLTILVQRSFFLQHRYDSHTCEDMSFGKKTIRSGRRFVYSTLSQVQHYHSYANYKKYFTRALVDLIAINGFLSPYAVKQRYDVVDLTINSAALVFGLMLRTLRLCEEGGAAKVLLDAAFSPRKRRSALNCRRF